MENALIENADLYFTNVNGRNGRNFVLKLDLKTAYGGVSIFFNMLKLQLLLEQLNLERFSDLKGTYIQIPDTCFGGEVKGIKSILAKDDEDWFKTENHIYFGSKFGGWGEIYEVYGIIKKIREL